jgi:hypothetical protein
MNESRNPIYAFRRAVPVLIICATAICRAQNQAAPVPVLKIGEIESEVVSQTELDTLERMIASYAVEMRAFRVIDARGTDLALSELEAAFRMGADAQQPAILSPDYVLSGQIGKLADQLILYLDNTKVRTGEKRSVSGRYASMNDMALDARALTWKLFDRVESSAKSQAPEAQKPAVPTAATVPESAFPLTLSVIAGTWKGDRGIDTVRIGKDGKGAATLSAGITMKVKASIVQGRYVVEQDQPNSSLFYSSPNVPAEVAKDLARKARPMRWIFALSADRATLSGIKESVAISGNPQGQYSIDNTYAREAAWTRLYQ